MPNYRIHFVGRLKGAIGAMYPITDYVTADTPEAASLKLYDKYEHIYADRPRVVAED